MEFIIGIYDVDRSGETERMSIRGSSRIGESSIVDVGVIEGLAIRFMSRVFI
jgi:hypothetical protein